MEEQVLNQPVRDNLTDKSTWMRLIYIVLFAIAFNIAEILIAIITIVQFFTVLFTKSPNARLQALGGDLGHYIGEVARFLTYQSDHMPYPVSDWGQATETGKTAAKKAPVKKKSAPRKKAPPKDKDEE